MKQYLNYIKKIIDVTLRGTISTFENLASLFIMNRAASEDDIEKCETSLYKKLPDEYKFFLQEFNGGILFKIDDYAGFKLLSTEELIKHNNFQKENFGQEWDSQIILFCECIGDAESLGFKYNESGTINIVYCIMDMLPQEWEIIEHSFDDLINKLIEEKGKKYWLDSSPAGPSVSK